MCILEKFLLIEILYYLNMFLFYSIQDFGHLLKEMHKSILDSLVLWGNNHIVNHFINYDINSILDRWIF